MHGTDFLQRLLGGNEHKENRVRKPNIPKQANGSPFLLLLKVANLLTLSLALEEEVA